MEVPLCVRLLGGPLAGRVLETNDAPWTGGWFTAGEADWGIPCTRTR